MRSSLRPLNRLRVRRRVGRRWRKSSHRGVSDVVATILLLALTVTLFAAIFAWVTTFPPPLAQNNSQFQATLRITANQTYISGLLITHLAGPSIAGNGLVYLASSTQPTALEFNAPANPYSISSGLGGAANWNLGQVWNLTFPLTQMPRAGGNITVYIVVSSQLLFSVILPGTVLPPPPTVTSTAVSPATPTIGTIYTVYATISGAYTANSVYVNLAAVPGGPSSPQKMTLNSQGFWTYTVPSGATANGTFYGFVNASNGGGQQSTGIVVVTIYPSSTSTTGPLSVGVILVPSPPNAIATETVQAVVTYTGPAQGAGLSVAFTAVSVPHSATTPWTGSSASGLTISGTSSVTAVSQTTWTIPATTVATSFVVYANATTSGSFVGSATGTMSFTTAAITVSSGHGDVGASISPGVAGTNFASSASISYVNLTLGGVPVTPVITGLTTGACPGSGNTIQLQPGATTFTCAFTVPGGAASGTQSLVASDTSSGQTASVAFTVYADPTVAVTPSTSPILYDIGQTATALTATSTYSGSNTATIQWYKGSSTTCSADTTTSGGSTTTSTLGLTPTITAAGTTDYCARVTDSGVPAYTGYSNVVTVTVTTALGTPTISPASPTIDSGQSLTFTSTWTNGAPSYTAVLDSGASATCSSDITVVQTLTGLSTGSATFTAVSPGATIYYCIVVTDSATTPTSATSANSHVTVHSALTAPAVPSVTYPSSTTATVVGVIPSTGTSTYTYTWLVSVNGAAYATSTYCTTNSAAGVAAGAMETCSASGLSTTATYSWELQVKDSATTPETVISASTPSTLTLPRAGPVGSTDGLSAGVTGTGQSAGATLSPAVGNGMAMPVAKSVASPLVCSARWTF